jgi:type IV pilus assembly protein PilM
LTLEHSRAWLSHVGLTAPLEDLEGDPEVIGAARTVLEEGLRRIVDGVRNSIDFYGAQPDAPAVSEVVLTGPGLTVPGLQHALSHQLGLPVRAGTVAQAQAGAVAPGAEPCVAVAAGLAVDEVPE